MSTFTIIARRWFDQVYGNTYHSVEVYRDGNLIERNPFSYGYGDGYQQTAMDIIKRKCKRIYTNVQKKYYDGKDVYMSPHIFGKHSGHKVIVSSTDVTRRRDL